MGYPAQPQPYQQQQPAQPQQYDPNQQFYGNPQQPGYAPAAQPQQYPAQPVQQQYAPAPPAPAQPVFRASIQDWNSQPAVGGGDALKWPVIGTRYVGQVARNVTTADIQQQTDPKKKPGDEGFLKFHRDGVTPKLSLLVPLIMQPSPLYPDGRATFYVQNLDRDELNRAMGEVGAPRDKDGNLDFPRAGDTIDVTYTYDKPNRQGAPSKIKSIQYTIGNGVAPQAQAPVQQQFAPQPQQQFAPQPQQQFAPQPQQQFAPQPQQQFAPQPQQQFAPQPPQQQFAPQPQQQFAPQPQQQFAPQPQQQFAPAPQGPPASIPGLTPEQAQQVQFLAGQNGGAQPGQPVASPQP